MVLLALWRTLGGKPRLCAGLMSVYVEVGDAKAQHENRKKCCRLHGHFSQGCVHEFQRFVP